MSNLTEITEVFRNLSETENETMFAQGILLAKAIEAGMKPKDVTRECGIAAGKSAQTMLNRLKVGLIFGDEYCKDMDWSVHLVAATAPKVDYRDPYTHMHARAVIDTAIAGYVDENGNHCPHTARTLKAAIRAAAQPAGGKAKAETVLDKVEGIYHGYDVSFNRVSLTLELPCDLTTAQLQALDYGETVTVTITITRAPQPALAEAVADESEVAL